MKTKKIHRNRWSSIAWVLGMISNGIAGNFTVVKTEDSGSGSLYWAIQQAELNAGPDTVRFAIPETDPGFDGTAWLIRPKITMPVISDDSTAILGGSQTEAVGDKNPDGPEIVLDGADMPQNSTCLTINSEGNLISGLVFTGSRSDGITIVGDNAKHNRIVGNYFGTNPAGTEPRPNTVGISMQLGARANQVGGLEPSDGNLISGCLENGIYIFQSDSNIVTGNIIGLDRTGTQVLRNGLNGISISSSRDNRVGGALSGERNVISGNSSTGIVIWIDKTTRNNTIQGNFIGTDKSGEFALGNGNNGIVISNEASANLIGGTEPGESNLISGNTGYGIYLLTSATDSNRVEGNWIGTDSTGSTALPNSSGGICIYNGPQYNQIGPSNTIRCNFDGISMQYETTLYNRITQNSISNNIRSGIIFFNGANGGINPPSLSWDGLEATGSTIADGRVEIFSDSCSQGRIYEGSVTADESGQFSWIGTPRGPFITATVTDPAGNTSEFSQPATVTAVNEKNQKYPQMFSLTQNFPNPFNSLTTIRFSVKEPCRVVLNVFDMLGRKAAEIVNDDYLPGTYEVAFDASGLASGIYHCTIQMGDYSASKKIVLQK